jgi:hypothetical protein
MAMLLAAGTLAATAQAETVTIPLTGTTITNVFNAYWGMTQTLYPTDTINETIGGPTCDIIVCNIVVSNLGPDSRYSMFQVTVPGGSLQGADWSVTDFNPTPVSGLWTPTIGLNTTTLNGNGDVISFGTMETFQYTLTYQPYVTSTGSASAVAGGGDGLPMPYNSPTLSGLNVPVATPEPGSGALLGMGLLAVAMRRRRRTVTPKAFGADRRFAVRDPS